MSSIYVLRQPHISSIVLLSGTPIVAAWKWNHLSFWRFFPCLEVIFGPLWGQSLWWGRLWSCWFSLVLWAFRLFMGPAQAHRLSLLKTPTSWPFQHSKHAQHVQFWRENTIKPGNKNAKRANGSIFTHVHPNKLMFSSAFVLREPTQPKKSPSLPCASLEPKLRNTSIRIYSPPIPKTRNRCWCATDVGREFCAIPPQLIF